LLFFVNSTATSSYCVVNNTKIDQSNLTADHIATYLGRSGPHLIVVLYAYTNLQPKWHLESVQPFLHRSWLCPAVYTFRQTDRQTTLCMTSVTIGHSAVRPNNNNSNNYYMHFYPAIEL